MPRRACGAARGDIYGRCRGWEREAGYAVLGMVRVQLGVWGGVVGTGVGEVGGGMSIEGCEYGTKRE